MNSNNIEIAQYRNKSENKSEIKKDLELIGSLFNGKLIVNDYIEFISLADGLHLGQEDLISISIDYKEAINHIREKIGNKILGVSTHNLGEIADANRYNIDYIGLGAYRETTTKNVSAIGGKELLNTAKLSKHKVALIGGVKLSDDFSNYPQIEYKVIGSDLVSSFLETN